MKKMKKKIKKWYQKADKKITIFLFRFLPRVCPLRTKKICFLSDSREVMGGNLGAIYDYLENQDYQRVVMFKMDRRIKTSFFQKLKLIYTLVTSHYILLEDMVAITTYLRVRKNQELVQLWHGPGAFKKFGFSRKTNGEKIGAIHTGYKKYTKAIVSSDAIKWCYAEAFSISEEKIKATGFPRTDDFFHHDYLEKTKQSFYQKYPNLKDKKIILFAPTYRGTKVNDAAYDYSQLNFQQLYQHFHDEYVMIIKWHPMYYNNIILGKQKAPDLSGYQDFFLDFSDYRDINDLLIVCDLLITDYSSMVFDYVLLNKPIIYFAYDLEQYTQYGGRGLYFDFDDYVYGKIAKNQDDLIDCIQYPEMMEDKRQKFIAQFMNACDGHSTEKTWNYISGRDD